MNSRKVSARITSTVAAGANAPAATVWHEANTAAAMRHAMIAEAAYFLAERRGFASGLEQQDWFAAEQLVDDAFGNPPAGGRRNP